MRAILTIVRMHLTLAFQDRATYIQALAVPAVLMLILSVALNEENFDVALLVDVVDNDQTALSAEFIDVMQNTSTDTETLIFCVYGTDDIPDECDLEAGDTFDSLGQTRLEDEQVAAAVVIPAGFGTALENGSAATIDYRSNDQVSLQSVASTAVETAITHLGSSIMIAQVGTQTAAAHFEPYENEDARLAAYAELRESARTELESPSAVVNEESSGETVIIGLGARQSVPGMGCMFVMFSLLSLSQFLVEERLQGTLYRLFTMPTSKVKIVTGKVLGAFLFGVLQFTIFIVFGAFLGIDWGDDLLAVAALVVAFCLAGTALGFLLATFVRTVAQAGSMITLFGLILAPLGGAWWPLNIVPEFMRIIGHVSPIAWAMDGFQELLYYNGTLMDVLPMVGALLVFAVVFTTGAVLNFKYE